MQFGEVFADSRANNVTVRNDLSGIERLQEILGDVEMAEERVTQIL